MGTRSFAVHALDAVGNAASAAISYSVTYGVCLLYDPTKAYRSGSVVAIRLRVCDAAGAKLSSAATVLTATGVSPPGALQNPGNTNPGGVFTWDPGTQSYLYTLGTKGFPAGDYALSFVASGDPVAHQAPFRVR